MTNQTRSSNDETAGGGAAAVSSFELDSSFVIRHSSFLDALIILGLFVGTFVLYARVAHFDFINYDDGDYVTRNPVVRQGLTWQGVQWAFTTGHAANWHPVTWLSQMLDVTLFGVDAPGAA